MAISGFYQEQPFDFDLSMCQDTKGILDGCTTQIQGIPAGKHQACRYFFQCSTDPVFLEQFLGINRFVECFCSKDLTLDSSETMSRSR